MLIKRRQFITKAGMASAGTLLIPRFLQALGRQQGLNTTGRKLVIIQLSGGNDGLNTVIPIRNDIYYKVRPRLAVPAAKALTVTDEVALHPALSAFEGLMKSGEMAILNSVGYPNPDRSHFRSMDIWHTASPATEYWETGWLGRYLDATCSGCDKPTKVLELNDVLSLALKGEKNKGLAFQDPARLYRTSQDERFKKMLAQHEDHDHDPLADYLYKTLGETLQSAEYIYKEASQHKSGSPTYPNSGLGKSLQTIASLIGSDINTSVYYASLGSFDTHVGQEGQQNRLLKELNDAVKVFVDDLKQRGRFNETLVVTFSEFGRRVAQNASGGTDHGTANNMFFVGGGLRQKGMLNAMPDLENLDNGDLRFQVDFRNVYATLLESWLGTSSAQILKSHFKPMQFV